MNDNLEKIAKFEDWYAKWEETLRGWKFNYCMDEFKSILDECPCSEASREECARCQDVPVWYFDSEEKQNENS